MSATATTLPTIQHDPLDIYQADLWTALHEAGHAVMRIALWPRLDTSLYEGAPQREVWPGGSEADRPFDRIVVHTAYDIAALTALKIDDEMGWCGAVEGVRPAWHPALVEWADPLSLNHRQQWLAAARVEVLTELAGSVAQFAGTRGSSNVDRLVEAAGRVMVGGLDHLGLDLELDRVMDILRLFDLSPTAQLRDAFDLVTAAPMWAAITALARRLIEVHEIEWDEARVIVEPHIALWRHEQGADRW